MWSIISAFIPLALRIIGMKLEKDKASADAIAAFIKTAEAAAPGFTMSAKLKESYDNQKKRMDETEAKWKELEAQRAGEAKKQQETQL